MADQTTTHYGLVQPQVGASLNTWGGKLNNDLAQLDTLIWGISAGIQQGVNAQSSANTITLTNPLVTIQQVAFSASSQKLVMPAMNTTSSPQVGAQLVIQNNGSYAFIVVAQDGTTVLYGNGVGATTITGGGAGYTNGVYTDVPLTTNGSGTGARATITVAAGAVTSIQLTARGTGYSVGDILSATAANIGGSGAGFSAKVSALIGLPAGATLSMTVSSNGTANGSFIIAQRGDLISTNNLSDVANANTALNNLLPPQPSNGGAFLQTNGAGASWQNVAQRCGFSGLVASRISSGQNQWTIEQITAATALGGSYVNGYNLSLSINLSNTGANGMDTGSPPNASNLYIYAIYNPTTSTWALLATASGNGQAIYPGTNMPPGYTASCLVSSFVTISGVLPTFAQNDRFISVQTAAISGSGLTSTTWAPVSCSVVVPYNAKAVCGYGGNYNTQQSLYVASQGNGGQAGQPGQCMLANGNGLGSSFPLIALTTPQQISYLASSGQGAFLYISGYTF